MYYFIQGISRGPQIYAYEKEIYRLQLENRQMEDILSYESSLQSIEQEAKVLGYHEPYANQIMYIRP